MSKFNSEIVNTQRWIIDGSTKRLFHYAILWKKWERICWKPSHIKV